MPMSMDPAGTGKLRPGVRQGSGQPVAILAQPAAQQIFQRTATTGGALSKGQASVPVTVSFPSAVSSLEYRVRDAINPGTTIVDWTSAAGALSAGSNALSLTIPAGAYWYTVDIRSNGDSSTLASTTNRFGVGRVILMAGQSEAVYMYARLGGQSATMASLGVAINPLTAVYGAYTDSQSGARNLAVGSAAWAAPADGSNYDSTGVTRLLDLQQQASGVATGMIGFAYGGTAIASWLPGQGNNGSLSTVVAAAGSAFEAISWYQGATDANGGTTQSNYQARLTSLFTSLLGMNSGSNRFTGTIAKLICQEQPINSAYGTLTQNLVIRAAQIAWAAANGASFVTMSDADTIGLEITQQGYVNVARHMHRALMPQITGSGTGDLGPSLGTPSVSGSTVTIPVTHVGGNALVAAGASWYSRFVVRDKGAETAYTVSGGTLNPASIVLNLSSAPSGQVDVIYDQIPSGTATPSANAITDNNTTDGLTPGRPLMGNAPLPTLSKPAITLTSPTFDTTTQKFGTAALKGGYGSLPGSALPATTYTLEGWGKISGTPSASVALFGGGNYGWVGMTTAGKFTGQVGSAAAVSSTVTVNDGQWHHFAVAVDTTANTAKFFLDGTLIATNAATGSGSAPTTYGVGIYGTTTNTAWSSIGGETDEFAVFNIAKSAITVPTGPYAGTETGLVGLWHLDGDGASAV